MSEYLDSVGVVEVGSTSDNVSLLACLLSLDSLDGEFTALGDAHLGSVGRVRGPSWRVPWGAGFLHHSVHLLEREA